MREKVVVLMSTFNGEKYLEEQLESLLNQENVDIEIIVRDDGSTDSTIRILKEYQKHNKLTYYQGTNLKPAKSFFELIYNAPDSEYYALCDQDDFWKPNKLSEAIKKIKDVQGAALYYCGMNIVDEKLKKYDEYHRNKKFSTSLKYSSIFGGEISGCTMVFNKSLMNEVREYYPQYITMHDTWIHRVALCVGGKIIEDEECYIDYRQHANNVIGLKKKSVEEKIKQIKQNKHKCKKIAREILNGYEKKIKLEDREFLELILQNDIFSKIKLSFIKFDFNIGVTKRLKLIFKIFFNIL